MMRFYIMTDMEGTSGIVDFDNYVYPHSLFYEKAKKLVTMEVNAAIEGILSTGDHEIIVCDGHGYGAIDIELLHKEARLIMGRPLDLMFEMGDGHYDALFMVGQHAMKNAPGANLGHTFDHVNIISLSINGSFIGEAGVNALRAGIFECPTIFLSGDAAACKEVKEIIPAINTCSVKRGINETAAICAQPEKAREKIREGTKIAVTDMENIKPYKLQPPYEAEFVFVTSNGLIPYINLPYSCILPGNKVRIYAENMKELLEKRLWGKV